MRNYILINVAFLLLICGSCVNNPVQQTKSNLSATEFSDKIKEFPASAVIDVRTTEEFSKGHLANAKNIDWNGDDFSKQIASLDKSKPVFVYCLSGGRSSAAAKQMRSDGFNEVYELNGGIMKWRGANLPEVIGNTITSSGLSKQQFDELLKSDKLVLIDFYADWCVPCKEMKPYLDEISKEMTDKVAVIRINADDNQSLCKELNIDALPVLQLYKNKTMTWSHSGYIDKAGVLKQL